MAGGAGPADDAGPGAAAAVRAMAVLTRASAAAQRDELRGRLSEREQLLVAAGADGEIAAQHAAELQVLLILRLCTVTACCCISGLSPSPLSYLFKGLGKLETK